ncbi:hypothetical protein [Vibrio paucivorans]|uniref:Uncharacterized protein n=1 Tax=Vibrio paucivorans TaxID=2829489 RepID=A0A9X3HTU1_9VIBR|nr:hypothetical protein [Vibrio paucivorans]MCW8335442.1 hypothetical protein [Vibrio paucivorans]
MKSIMVVRLVTALLLVNTSSLNAGTVAYPFPVSSYIDLSHLYPFSLFLEVEEPYLDLIFDEELGRFKDSSTTLAVSSDIPSGESKLLEYQFQLTRNASICNRFGQEGEAYVEDIVDVHVDNQALDEGEYSEHFKFDKVDENGFAYGENELLLTGNQIDGSGLECQGEVILVVEIVL